MFVATAESQEIATQIAKTCNPGSSTCRSRRTGVADLRVPVLAGRDRARPGLRVPLNHVVAVDASAQLVRTRFVDAKEAARAKVSDVCRYVRSKNAGPFWITLDLMFRDAGAFDRYARSPSLDATRCGLYGVDAAQIKRFALRDLLVLKISYPRAVPQGGALERDMHGGQQYVRILDLDLEPSSGDNA
jgi:hypothetical protein